MQKVVKCLIDQGIIPAKACPLPSVDVQPCVGAAFTSENRAAMRRGECTYYGHMAKLGKSSDASYQSDLDKLAGQEAVADISIAHTRECTSDGVLEVYSESLATLAADVGLDLTSVPGLSVEAATALEIASEHKITMKLTSVSQHYFDSPEQLFDTWTRTTLNTVKSPRKLYLATVLWYAENIDADCTGKNGGAASATARAILAQIAVRAKWSLQWSKMSTSRIKLAPNGPFAGSFWIVKRRRKIQRLFGAKLLQFLPLRMGGVAAAAAFSHNEVWKNEELDPDAESSAGSNTDDERSLT